VSTTFLGAHALPPEAAGDKDAYITSVCEDMLPAVAAAGLADSVDAFCETIGFTAAQVARVFDKAKALGLPVKLHGRAIVQPEGRRARRALRRTVGRPPRACRRKRRSRLWQSRAWWRWLLPGAFYFVRETHKPPVEELRRQGVRIAIASDCNPGTSPLTSLLLAMNMGATLFRLTVEECLAGVTREAARALGRLGSAGNA